MSSMLIMPTRNGWLVEYESENISRRTGKKIWETAMETTKKEKAEAKFEELKKQGKNARMLECIF